MYRRKNKKRIDPRHFLDETIERVDEEESDDITNAMERQRSWNEPASPGQREPDSIYAGERRRWRPERIKAAAAQLLPFVSGTQDIKKAWNQKELPPEDTSAAERVNRTLAAVVGELGEMSPLAPLFKAAQAQAELRGLKDDPLQAAVGSIGRGPRSGLPGGQAGIRLALAREWENDQLRADIAANAAKQREEEYDDVLPPDYDDDSDEYIDNEIVRATVNPVSS